MKRITVKCDIYKRDVVFYFNTKKEEILKDITTLTEITEEETKLILKPISEGRTILLDSGVIVIIIREIPRLSRWKGVLAHEIFHAACFMLHRAGLSFADNSDEAYAYLIDFITRRFYDNY